MLEGGGGERKTFWSSFVFRPGLKGRMKGKGVGKKGERMNDHEADERVGRCRAQLERSLSESER